MAFDPKKNLEDIGLIKFELKDIYGLVEDPEIDTILPNPHVSEGDVTSVDESSPGYKRLQDYDGNIKIWLDKVIDYTQSGTGDNNFNYDEIDVVNKEFIENANEDEKDELDEIFSGNLDFSNPTDEELKSIAFRMYEAYQLLKQIYDT